MAIADLPILSVLKAKMHWHQARQRVLAENVANADTPGYRAHELAVPELGRAAAAGPAGGMVLTNRNHIAAARSDASSVRENTVDGFETTPDGNGVVLEEQMMKVTGNQMDFEAAITLYQKSLGLIRTAIRS